MEKNYQERLKAFVSDLDESECRIIFDILGDFFDKKKKDPAPFCVNCNAWSEPYCGRMESKNYGQIVEHKDSCDQFQRVG